MKFLASIIEKYYKKRFYFYNKNQNHYEEYHKRQNALNKRSALMRKLKFKLIRTFCINKIWKDPKLNHKEFYKYQFNATEQKLNSFITLWRIFKTIKEILWDIWIMYFNNCESYWKFQWDCIPSWGKSEYNWFSYWRKLKNSINSEMNSMKKQ